MNDNLIHKIIKNISDMMLLVVVTYNIYDKYPVPRNFPMNLNKNSFQMIFKCEEDLLIYLKNKLKEKNKNIFKKVLKYVYHDRGFEPDMAYEYYIKMLADNLNLNEFNLGSGYWVHNQHFKIHLIKSNIIFDKMYSSVYNISEKLSYSVLFYGEYFNIIDPNETTAQGLEIKKYKTFAKIEEIDDYIDKKMIKFIKTKKHNLFSNILNIYLNQSRSTFNSYLEHTEYKSYNFIKNNINKKWLSLFQKIQEEFNFKDNLTFAISIEKSNNISIN